MERGVLSSQSSSSCAAHQLRLARGVALLDLQSRIQHDSPHGLALSAGYSMTTSARRRIAGGTFSPRIFAVFKLTANS